MSFFNVKPLDEAVELAIRLAAGFQPASQTLPLLEAVGQRAAKEILAPRNVPEFSRSTVDGYAVRARDVGGASEFSPGFLQVVGKVEMGQAATRPVEPGEAIYVPTGGMMPPGADAVVMIEYVEDFDETTLAIYQTVAPGTGVMQAGEDMEAGTCVVNQGEVLTVRHLGVLAALGQDQVEVKKPPRLAYYSTGDEIVPPPTPLKEGQVWDITRYTCQGLLAAHGFSVDTTGHIADHPEEMKNTLGWAVENHQVVILSGGSSVGNKDLLAQTINALGTPGVVVHGLLLRPGKPAIVAKVGDTLIFGLPGHPSSSYVVSQLLVLPVLKAMMGQPREEPLLATGVLTRNVPAGDGRRTVYPVQLEKKGGRWQATPLFGKSGAISWLANAHGYLVLPEGTEGLTKGEIVDIHRFD